MLGIRVSIYMHLPDPFFFEEDYKQSINKELVERGLRGFVFSDLVCRKKVQQKEGFYGWKGARFDFSTIYPDGLFKIVKKISGEGLAFRYGRVREVSFKIRKISKFSEGYLLSPALVLDSNGESLDFASDPVLYSEMVRSKLIHKYEEIFGCYPQNDSFILVYPYISERIDRKNMVYIKSKLHLYGSEELVYLANVCGIGDFNEQGMGMIAEDLYFFKKKGSGGLARK